MIKNDTGSNGHDSCGFAQQLMSVNMATNTVGKYGNISTLCSCAISGNSDCGYGIRMPRHALLQFCGTSLLGFIHGGLE